MTGVQLQALDAGVRVALFQILDDLGGRRIGVIPTYFVGTTFTAPNTIVGRLDASDAIGLDLAQFLMRGHSTRWGVVQAPHVLSIVHVVLEQCVPRYFRYRDTPPDMIVPHALYTCPRVQTLILFHQVFTMSRCIPGRRKFH